LLLAPNLAAHLFDLAAVLRVIKAIAAFSLTASSIYILNDFLNLNADSCHLKNAAAQLHRGPCQSLW